MPAPTTAVELLDLVRKSGILPGDVLDARLKQLPKLPADSTECAGALVRNGVLTRFQAKQLLTGRYRGFKLGPHVLREQIGQGGMGAVFLAEHETLRRNVAIKILTKTPGEQKVAVERFFREARAVAALDHPNIVRIFDVVTEKDFRYLVMEYADGESLDKVVEKGGPLPLSRTVDYIIQAAAGLQHAHEKGFIHRDIKPANLLVTKDGVVKILDMGLARSTTTTEDKLTEAFDKDAILGTADYIAPEQALNSQDIDIRADIYSLGVTFYTLVAGAPPFGGTTTQKLLQHQMKTPPPLAQVDPTIRPEVSAVVAKMMAKDPAKRYQTPNDVIAALEPWLGTPAEGAKGSADTTGRRARTKGRANSAASAGRPAWLLPAVGGGVVALLAAVGVTAYALSGGGKLNTVPTTVAAQTPVTSLAAPIGGGVPAPPAGAPKTVYALDLSKVEPFVLPMTKRNASELDAPGKLPAPWKAESLNPGKATEIAFEAADGAQVVSLKNLERGAVVQFFTMSEIAVQHSGSSYTVAIEYRAEGGGRGGKLETRSGVAGASADNKVYPMPDTAGQWTKVEFDLPPVRSDKLLLLFLHGLDTTEGNRFSVRSLSVLERTP